MGTPRRRMPTNPRPSTPPFFSRISWASRTSVRSISEPDINCAFCRSAVLRTAFFFTVMHEYLVNTSLNAENTLRARSTPVLECIGVLSGTSSISRNDPRAFPETRGSPRIPVRPCHRRPGPTCLRISYSFRQLGRQLSATLEEREQICVDLVRVGCRHPVRKPWIHLMRGVLHNLGGHQTRRADWHDLVVVAMHDEGRHIDLLEVFSEVRLRESLDAVVVGLHSSQHALQPPVFPNAFRNLGAGPVVAVEGEGNVPVKLRPICRKLGSEVIEDRDGQATGILFRLQH